MGLGKGLLEFGQPQGQIPVGLYPILVVYPRAGAQQLRRLQGVIGDHDRQPAPVGIQVAVGLVLDQAADAKGRRANVDLVANTLAQPFGQHRVDHRTPQAILLCRQLAQGLVGYQLQLAI